MAKKETKETAPVAEEKALVSAANTAVVAFEEAPESAWGAENISAQDIVIPKILLMQGMSKLVSDGRAAVGDLVDSITVEKLGNRKEPLSFIPFLTFKTWIESKKKGEKYEFVRQVPMDATNEDLPVEFTEGESIMRRDRSLNVYVLLPRDIARGEGVMPYVISFRRTSYQGGKTLATMIQKLAEFNKPAASKTFELIVADKENDKGKFVVLTVGEKGVTPRESMNLAYKWYKKVRAGVKVDESDLVEVEPENIAKPNVSEAEDAISY